MENNVIKIGGIYKHFKGNYYIVLDLGVDTETLKKVVIYKQVDNNREDNSNINNTVWVRPLDMFLSKVDKEKYLDVEQEYRFEYIERNI